MRRGAAQGRGGHGESRAGAYQAAHGALDAVEVELLRRPVGGGHHDEPRREELVEEAAHHQGVRHVGHLELVEAEQLRRARDVVRNPRQRVAVPEEIWGENEEM